jgi:hypothetical protein
MAESERPSRGTLAEVLTQIDAEGYKEGTPRYEQRLRQIKVTKCREIRGYFTCDECPAFDHCEITKQVLRDHRGLEEL